MCMCRSNSQDDIACCCVCRSQDVCMLMQLTSPSKSQDDSMMLAYWYVCQKSQDVRMSMCLCRSNSHDYPCGKQHFREIATPDWVRTLRTRKHTHECVRYVNWPTQSGVAISRTCCFPHGWLYSMLMCLSIHGSVEVKMTAWCSNADVPVKSHDVCMLMQLTSQSKSRWQRDVRMLMCMCR